MTEIITEPSKETVSDKTKDIKYSLFIHLVRSDRDINYIWLVLYNDTLKFVQEHVNNRFSGEEDKIIIVEQEEKYTDRDIKRLFTWNEFSEKFPKKYNCRKKQVNDSRFHVEKYLIIKIQGKTTK